MKPYFFGSALLLVLMTSAHAKLPAPPPVDPAKAAEAAAKAAWSTKVSAWQLCRVQDRVAARFGKHAEGAAPASTCVDPGPFVAPEAPKS
jgi:hypothetical protein